MENRPGAVPVKKIDPEAPEVLKRQKTENPVEAEDNTNMKKLVTGVYAILIILGVLTGFLLSRGGAGSKSGSLNPQVVTGEKSAGVEDTIVFKDSASGKLEKGGIDGEGTHQLTRDGGPSQTVYLTSSVVDLDEFVGQDVTVWGQTMDAQKAGWLMDVGKIVAK